MEKEYELLNFDRRDLVISAEDAADPALYRQARSMATERGVELSVAAPAPPPWQPPENSLAISQAEAKDPVRYREARAEADEGGLELVVAPDSWSGPSIRTGENAGETWTPPPNAVVAPFDCDQETWGRCCDAAKRLGVPVVLAPPEAAVVVPVGFKRNSPIAIPQNASPAEYRRLKALAGERHVTYHIIGD